MAFGAAVLSGPSRAAMAASRDRLDAWLARHPGADGAGQLSDELLAVAELLGRESGLRRALADPSLPAEVKNGVLDDLLRQRASAAALDLLEVVAAQRWSSARDLAEAVETLGVAAAFARADEQGTLDDVEDQLFRFGRIVAREPGLRSALTDPAVSAERKRALLTDLLSGRVDPTSERLLTLVVTQPGSRSLDRAIEDLARLAAERRQRTVARVTSAVPLSQVQQDTLAQSLGRDTGRPVQLQVDVDPGLQGGVVVRIGDEVIDGSVSRRLEDLRRRLGGR